MASCRSLIISLQDLETYCNVSESVYSNEVDTRTDLMQLKYIKPLLGEGLFNEILEQIEAGTITALNQSLIDKISPALSWLVYSDFVIDTNIKNNATGMVKSVGDTFTLATDTELAGISKRAYGNWQVYEKELIDYLKENKTDYPLWEDKSCYNKGIAGYSISAIGGKQNIKREYNVHYPTRYGK